MKSHARAGISSPVARPDEPVHWLVRPRTVRGLWIGFGLILTVLVLGDFLVHGHPGFGVDGTFGFYAWYGLGTCVAMVLFAKALGLAFKRSDTYYDPEPDAGPEAETAAWEEAGGKETPAARKAAEAAREARAAVARDSANAAETKGKGGPDG